MPTSSNSRAGGGHDNSKGASSTASNQQGGKKDTHINSGVEPNQDSSADQKRQTSSSRKLAKQNLMRRFMKLREDAQLAGLIRTEPKEAIEKFTDERVETKEQPQPKLIETAIKSGWAVPEEIKPELVQELIAVTQDEETPDRTKVAAFRALLTADQHQHNINNPQTNKTGGQVNVSVQTNIAAVDVLRQSLNKDTSPKPIEDK